MKTKVRLKRACYNLKYLLGGLPASLFWQLLLLPLIAVFLIRMLSPAWTGAADFMLKLQESYDQRIAVPEKTLLLSINYNDDRLYKQEAGASAYKNFKAWRKLHAKVINRLAELPNVPRLIVLDFYFLSEDPEQDPLLLDAIKKLRSRGSRIILPLQCIETVSTCPWINKAYQKNWLTMATCCASVWEKDFRLFEYPLWKQQNIILANSRVLSAKVPNLALAAFREKPLAKKYQKNLSLRPIHDTVPILHYNDILDDNQLAVHQQDLADSVIFIGFENPKDIQQFSQLPKNLAIPGMENYWYGLYTHYLAYANLKNGELIQHLATPYLEIFLFALAFCTALYFYLFYRSKIFYRPIGSLIILIIALLVCHLLGFRPPLISVSLTSILISIIILIPELKLHYYFYCIFNQLPKKYYNQAQKHKLFLHLTLQCRCYRDWQSFIRDIYLVLIEDPKKAAKTFFQESIPIDFFKKNDFLENPHKENTKYLKRADSLKEDFIGTRLRRLRNIYSHSSGLSSYAIDYARAALKFFTGKRNVFLISSWGFFYGQQKVLKELLRYAALLKKYDKKSPG